MLQAVELGFVDVLEVLEARRQVWINVYMAGCTVIAAVGAAKGARS